MSTDIDLNHLTKDPSSTATATNITAGALPTRHMHVRWKILLLLSSFCFVSYFARTNLSVAAKPIVDQSGLSETQVGRAFTGFMIAYTVFQLPAGWFLYRFGARVILSTAAFGWPLTTACTGFVGSLRAAGGVTLVALVLIRIGLGVFKAPSFPGTVRVISRWFPDSERGIANSWMMTAENLAPSITTRPWPCWSRGRDGNRWYRR